jgi:hypothetical protein
MDLFWSIAGNYNKDTIFIQICLEVLLFATFVLVDGFRNKEFIVFVKIIFIIEFLWIGTEYFLIHGSAEYHNLLNAIPFYLIALCWCEDTVNKRTDAYLPFGRWSLLLYLVWPLFILFSILLGRTWPEMFGVVFPCNTIGMALIWLNIHSRTKNYILSALLVIMATPGGLVNVFHFKVYEDWVMVLMGVITVVNYIYQYRKSQAVPDHR